MLREAVEALPPPTGWREELARECSRRREVKKKISRLTNAIADGNGAGGASISKSIDEQEVVKAAVDERIRVIEATIAATVKRPDGEAFRSLWMQFTANWKHLAEGERTELMPLLIEKVTMDEKERGTMHLYLDSPLVRFAFPWSERAESRLELRNGTKK